MSVTIYYDGECYFCNNYVKKMELQERYGEITLISLRENTKAQEKMAALGFNVNNGFVVENDGQYLYGPEAFRFINGAKKTPGFLSNTFHKSEKAPKIIYNTLVFLRYIFLMIQGLGLINQTQQQNNFLTRSIRLTLILLSITFCLISVIHYDYLKMAVSLAFLGLFIWSFRKNTLTDKLSSFFEEQTYAFWLGYLFISLIITNLSGVISERRIIFFIAFLPFLGWVLDRYLSTAIKKTSTLLLLLSSAFVLIPGLYLAPFYGGISGWYVQMNKNKPIKAATYELIRHDGETIDLTHALLEPSTQAGRFRKAWSNAGLSNKEFMKFQFDNYKRLYPILKEGRFSHQRYLGKIAYPTHTLSDSDASQYKSFPPQSIKKIEWVLYTLSWEGKLLKRDVKEAYIVQ